MHLALRRVLVFVVLATVAAVVPTAEAGSEPSPPAADRALTRALARIVERPDGPPGIAAIVQRGDETTLHEAGTAVVDRDTPIRATDHLRIASVSKAFSGAVALHLVASGHLALDDTVGSRIPDIPRAWADVELRALLQHTSGIPDFSQTEAFRAALIASLQDPPPPRDLLDFAAGEPLRFAPGTDYAYSNSDNVIVALMAEAATGQAYEALLAELVAEPLGLTRTSLPRDAAMPTPAVRGYDLQPGSPPDDVTELFAAGWAWSSGGIVSSLADANRFVRAYALGATTDEVTRAAQRTFVNGRSEPPGPGTNAAGLAIFRYRTRCGTVYGHTGNTAGYTQFIAASPDGTRSAAVSVNAQLSPRTSRAAFRALREVYELAVCAALAPPERS